MSRAEDEADDCWTEFGAAGDPDRAPLNSRQAELRMNQELVRAGYRIEPSVDGQSAWTCECPHGPTLYALTHEAIWAAARRHYRHRMIK
jgi:hypothetical protein